MAWVGRVESRSGDSVEISDPFDRAYDALAWGERLINKKIEEDDTISPDDFFVQAVSTDCTGYRT